MSKLNCTACINAPDFFLVFLKFCLWWWCCFWYDCLLLHHVFLSLWVMFALYTLMWRYSLVICCSLFGLPGILSKDSLITENYSVLKFFIALLNALNGHLPTQFVSCDQKLLYTFALVKHLPILPCDHFARSRPLIPIQILYCDSYKSLYKKTLSISVFKRI